MFTERDEITVSGLASQAAVAMDNARSLRGGQESPRRGGTRRRPKMNACTGRRKNRAGLKEEFLATISHELRTPLSAILGWTRMLRMGQLSAENSAKALDTIERNARAQAQLVDDLLDVSRIITGKLRMDVRPGGSKFVHRCCGRSRAAGGRRERRARSKSHRHWTSFHSRRSSATSAGGLEFTFERDQVHAAWWPGRFDSERVNSHLEIVVSDTGQGIPPDFLPHVFDRFRQAIKKTSRQHGGMGLGLAIVRHLVEMHGGTVRASSEGEGKGATFTVMLPITPVYQVDSSGSRVHPAARDLLPPNDSTRPPGWSDEFSWSTTRPILANY